MDADLVRLVRAGKITRTLAEQRASVPEELKRLLGNFAGSGAGSADPLGNGMPAPGQVPPPAYVQGA
jgi:hypothetical protein